MRSRTASSTSAAVSRLAARKAANRASKSTARLSRRIGMANLGPARNEPSAQWRAIAAASTRPRRLQKFESCRAVWPVEETFGRDPSNSLRTGNLTGNFCGFGAQHRFSCQFVQHLQVVAPEFPEQAGTGNFFRGNREFSSDNREFQFPELFRGNDLPT